MPETVKWCPRCEQFLDRSSFGKHRARPDGLTAHCACCKRNLANEWAAEHDPDGARQRASSDRYRAVNMSAIQARGREAKRREALADPERVKARRKKWEIERRHVLREGWFRGAHTRRARLKAALIVPFTHEQLRQRLSMFDGCWVCGGEAQAVDHVKPLARGGAHALANLRPVCVPCNSSKRATWPYDYRRAG